MGMTTMKSTFPSLSPLPSTVVAGHIFLFSLLVIACVVFPLPVYLVALALFGLPHIIWEMGFLRSRYGMRWQRTWWWLLCLVLLLQAWARSGVWRGSVAADVSQIWDLLSLALLGVVVMLAPRGCGWLVRIAGFVLGASMIYLLQTGAILTSLLLLGLAHNFTPVALAWDMAREDHRSRRLAWMVTGLFLLPLLLLSLPLLTPLTMPLIWHSESALFSLHEVTGWGAMLTQQLPLLDAQLPAAWSDSFRQTMLCSMVLAQCLHYYSVIYLLPQAQRRRAGVRLWSPLMGVVISVMVLAMTVYFLINYNDARKLYSVAAGAHAWLEWPLLLMAFVSVAGHKRLLRNTDDKPV